jgi:hypothetical protein
MNRKELISEYKTLCAHFMEALEILKREFESEYFTRLEEEFKKALKQLDAMEEDVALAFVGEKLPNEELLKKFFNIRFSAYTMFYLSPKEKFKSEVAYDENTPTSRYVRLTNEDGETVILKTCPNEIEFLLDAS